MAGRPKRTLGFLVSSAALTSAESAVMAQLDFQAAMLAGDALAAEGFLGEMRAYREMTGALIAICHEARETTQL